jgi:hypothetical protein
MDCSRLLDNLAVHAYHSGVRSILGKWCLLPHPGHCRVAVSDEAQRDLRVTSCGFSKAALRVFGFRPSLWADGRLDLTTRCAAV